MPQMTESDLLRVAQEAVPEHIRPLGRVVRPDRGMAIAGMPRSARPVAPDDDLLDALAKKVGAKPAREEPNSADVEFPEQTALGLRTTVVHVRNGKVMRVLKRG